MNLEDALYHFGPQAVESMRRSGLVRKGSTATVDKFIHEWGMKDADEVYSALTFNRGEAESKYLEGLRSSLKQAPMNTGVDPERTVPVVHVEPASVQPPHLGALRKTSYGNAKVHVGNHVNDDTGWTVSVTAKGAKHVAQDHKNESHYSAMVQAMTKLPEIIKSAVLVETHPDLKNQAGVEQVHRLYAPVRVGDGTYVVKLTVKEKSPGEVNLDEFRLYDMKSEKKMSTGTSGPPPSVDLESSRPAVDISKVKLRDMLTGVKDNAGTEFMQSGPTRGSLNLPVGGYGTGDHVMNLFAARDKSTMLHEGAHDEPSREA